MSQYNIVEAVQAIEKLPGLHYRNPRIDPVSELQQQFFQVPHDSQCTGGLKVYAHGCVRKDCHEFCFEFWKSDQKNQVLHFKPRFYGGLVARNNRVYNNWGKEEDDGGMPFTRGLPFLLTFNAGSKGIEVEVDGVHFTKFAYRNNWSGCDVTHLNIYGGITVYSLHFLVTSLPIATPLSIPGNLHDGDMFFLRALVPQEAVRFSFNFKKGITDSSDYVYHFNPRFNMNETVFNDRKNEKWGEQEEKELIGVNRGDKFTFRIIVDKAKGILAYVNDSFIHKFRNRLEIKEAQYFIYYDDIHVESVTVDCATLRQPPEINDITEEEFETRVEQRFYVGRAPMALPIKGTFGVNKLVYLSGTVEKNSSGFSVDLRDGSGDEFTYIAIRCTAQWDEDGPGAIVINSYQDGSWGEDMRAVNNMEAGEEFHMHILCAEEGFCLVVEGDTVAIFPHRGTLSLVTSVHVEGSIDVMRLMTA